VGGVIAPGPAAFTDYLHARGAQLPVVRANPGKPTNILGRSTQAAITAAAVHGFRGMAKEILAQIQSALKTKTLHVVLAGGAADWLGTLPGNAVRRDSDLTFRGMLAIARRNA
jgi:pantothenate kinase type III